MSYPKEIIEKIGVKREILSTLPTNNKKNREKYVKVVGETLSEFQKIQKEILTEIKSRYSEIDKIEKKDNLSQIQKELNNISSILYLLNDINSSYEKMELDKRIHKLKYYYMNNLEEINSVILSAILKFKEVGIILTEDDFLYSRYVKEYITLFVEGIKRKKLDLAAIQERFESIYWRSPDIITHIELNFRYLYLLNKKRIDKYCIDKERYIISTMKSDIIFNRYNKLMKNRDFIAENDSYRIIHKFLDGELAPTDYTKQAMQDNYSKYMSEIFLDSILDSPKQDELDLNLSKLKNALYEYRQIVKYQYVVDNIQARYVENKENKSLKSEEAKILKEIAKEEKRVISITKRLEKSKFSKGNDEALHVTQNNIIREIKEKYKTYDTIRINNAIVTHLNDASTIGDVFKFITSFYRELYNITKEAFPDMTEDELDEMVQGLKDFNSWPYNILTNNFNINNDKDLIYIIKDRYSLMNINLGDDMLEIDSLETLIEDIAKFEQYYYIRRNNINIKKIIDFVNLKTLIDSIEKDKTDKAEA